MGEAWDAAKCETTAEGVIALLLCELVCPAAGLCAGSRLRVAFRPGRRCNVQMPGVAHPAAGMRRPAGVERLWPDLPGACCCSDRVRPSHSDGVETTAGIRCLRLQRFATTCRRW